MQGFPLQISGADTSPDTSNVDSSHPDHPTLEPRPIPPVVLVVDDDPDSLLLLRCLLEPFDCELICETNGYSALQTAQTTRPHLILLDIVLPDLSGLELTRQLRANPQTQAIPIIAVTALAHPKEQQQILAVGCQQCISKPYMVQDMEALLCQYLALVS